MDELPKTPTAKIRKQALRERGLTPTSYDRAPQRKRERS
jgi:acyl-coenzyme A synthetase/AMP-(fatty) acid ligase